MTTLQAAPLEFFQTRGEHSLTALFGLPAPAPRLDLVHSQFIVSGTHVNMFAGGQSTVSNGQQEIFAIDGERSELSLSYFRPINDCLQMGVGVPLVSHSRGYFDNAIEYWHDLFNLPNANRDEVAQDSLSIQYIDPEGVTISLESSDTSLGDISLHVIRPLSCDPRGVAVDRSFIRAGLKLPTGDDQVLAGSGAADVFFDITSTTKSFAGIWSLRGSVGLLFTGNSPLVTNQRPVVAFGYGALSVRYSSRLSFQIQTGWHSPLFDSGLTELGKSSVQLDTGLVWTFKSGSLLELAIQEDLTPDTSPDIGLFVSFKRFFGR